MHQLVENLESRTLFSTGFSPTLQADAARLKADGAAILAAYKQYGPTFAADLRTLVTSVRASRTPGSGALLSSMIAAGQRSYLAGRADVVRLLASQGVGLNRITVDVLRLAAHPDNAVLQARLTTDVAAHAAATAAKVGALAAKAGALGAAAASALSLLSAAFPTNTAVTTAIATFQADGAAFNSAAGASIQAGQADLQTFLTDVSQGK